MLSDYTEDRCRICLEKPESQVSLHKEVPIGEDKILISEILKRCGNIEVLHDDRKPQSACFACVENAKVSYKFKLTCVQSEITLNTEILNQNDPFQLEFKKEDDLIDIKDEDISNIKEEEPNLNNAEVGSETGEESNDSFHNFVNTEQEENSVCFENSGEQEESNNTIENDNDDDVENAGKTKECKHKCPHCDKSFKSRYNMLRHLHPHKSKEKKCSYCDYKGSGIQLGRHMDKNHDDCKSIQCLDCDKRFFQQRNLKMHMLIHMGVKRHVCDVCGKGFTIVGSLKKHRRSHTKEKPYKCDKCGKRYLDRSYLRMHLIRHTDDRPFVCKLCGKAYILLSELRRHEMVHSEERQYPCALCDKRFRHKQHWKQHMNTHTREFTFKCDMCSKEFITKSGLQAHLTTHTGEKPYVCKVCGKAFTQPQSLRRHKASVHHDT